jgi:hypothetical protein
MYIWVVINLNSILISLDMNHRIIVGYKGVKIKNHPNANSCGCIPLHRLIMEKHLGRLLTKQEVVHHIDGNIYNNNINNLALCNNNSEHMKLHKGDKRPDPFTKRLEEKKQLNKKL